MNKRYLFDIPHPHFVHFFKNTIYFLGYDNIIVTCQNTEIITGLLKQNLIPYIIVGNKYNSLFLKLFGQIRYLIKYISLINRHKIDVLIGMSPSVALAAKLTGRKIIFFDDDDSEVQPFTRRITVPLADLIITPFCLKHEKYGKKHLMYKGYQELAYLSPAYFSNDPDHVSKYGLKFKDYFLLRFNDFRAHHDLGHSGLSKSLRVKLISFLEKYGSVYITSESPLEDEFSKYQLKIDPNDIHYVLASAKMFIGDSQTMACEAAILGTPSIRCNTFKGRISYLNELESRYRLTCSYYPWEGSEMLEKISGLVALKNLDSVWGERRNYMLSQMEDVNLFIKNTLESVNA